MILDVAQSRSSRFARGGSVRFQTPHGLILLPLQLSHDPQGNTD